MDSTFMPCAARGASGRVSQNARYETGGNLIWVSSNRGRGVLLLDLADTNLGLQPRDLGEVPIDDIPRAVCEGRRPVAEQLGDHGERSVRHSAGVRHPVDGRPMRRL